MTNNPEPLTLVTVSDLESMGVRNAARRVREWVANGRLSEAGTYTPPIGEPVKLYAGDRAWSLATGT